MNINDPRAELDETFAVGSDSDNNSDADEVDDSKDKCKYATIGAMQCDSSPNFNLVN